MKSSSTVRQMVFMALYAAMAVVLDIVKDFIPFTSIWANGGSIDISLIPLVFASIHLGYKAGVITGLLEFLVSVIFGTTKLYFASYNPFLGFLGDYLIPVAVMGLAAVFMNKDKSEKSNVVRLEAGIVITMLVRMLGQILSGVYCWFDESAGMGSVAAWTYSLQYNLGYGIPTLVMLLVVMPLLYKLFSKQLRKKL